MLRKGVLASVERESLIQGPMLSDFSSAAKAWSRANSVFRLPEAGAATRRRGRCVRLLRCTRHKLTRRTRFSD